MKPLPPKVLASTRLVIHDPISATAYFCHGPNVVEGLRSRTFTKVDNVNEKELYELLASCQPPFEFQTSEVWSTEGPPSEVMSVGLYQRRRRRKLSPEQINGLRNSLGYRLGFGDAETIAQ